MSENFDELATNQFKCKLPRYDTKLVEVAQYGYDLMSVLYDTSIISKS